MTRRLAALVFVILVACAHPAAPTAPDPAKGEEERGWPFEIRVSYLVNLFHWVDNLAGTSLAKTREVYVRQWRLLHGPPDEGDLAALERFRRVRTRPEPVLGPSDLHPEGCAPLADFALSRRQQVNGAVLAAADFNDLERLLRRVLSERDASELIAVLEHFEPGFRKLWPRMRYLAPFQRQLAAYLRRARTRALTRRFAEFLEAPRQGAAPSVIQLVGLLEDGPTHAEANGRRLLLEIRPRDSPELQVQVIFHELAHDLLRRRPIAARREFAERFLRRGAAGALALALIHEALPTALGQGVAQARLTPRLFGYGQRWYHTRAVDNFAHDIYSDVRQEVESGRRLSDRLPDRLVDRVLGGPPPGVRLVDYLAHAAFASRFERLPAFEPLLAASAGRAQMIVATDRADGIAFLERLACMPVVWLATPEDLSAVDGFPGGWLTLPPALPADRGGPGWVLPARRASGAAVLVLVPSSAGSVDALVRAVAGSKGWPQEPTSLPPSGGSESLPGGFSRRAPGGVSR